MKMGRPQSTTENGTVYGTFGYFCPHWWNLPYAYFRLWRWLRRMKLSSIATSDGLPVAGFWRQKPTLTRYQTFDQGKRFLRARACYEPVRQINDNSIMSAHDELREDIWYHADGFGLAGVKKESTPCHPADVYVNCGCDRCERIWKRQFEAWKRDAVGLPP